jgi:hypothetical protein
LFFFNYREKKKGQKFFFGALKKVLKWLILRAKKQCTIPFAQQEKKAFFRETKRNNGTSPVIFYIQKSKNKELTVAGAKNLQNFRQLFKMYHLKKKMKTK